ncbi:hypothetical protein [Mycolicibacterium sp. S3B2]|uniref:hypothetical protein n=1 Tax=Mycolicibacterium sp. S3B2 TaxID=3415120 RepID=UPI003C7E3AF6
MSSGDAHLHRPAGDYSFWAWNTAAANVTITTANPTNPRIDAIIAKVDTSITTTASNNSPGSFVFQAIAGTPAGSPTAPADATIQTAIGSGVAWIRLANVTVGAAASSITNANISDQRVAITSQFTLGANSVTTSALAASAVTTSKINAGAVTSTKLSLSKTTDANGWTVFDYGTWKEYYKLASFTGSDVVGNGQTRTLTSSNLPDGVSNLSSAFFEVTTTINEAFMWTTHQATPASTSIVSTATNLSGSNRTRTYHYAVFHIIV